MVDGSSSSAGATSCRCVHRATCIAKGRNRTRRSSKFFDLRSAASISPPAVYKRNAPVAIFSRLRSARRALSPASFVDRGIASSPEEVRHGVFTFSFVFKMVEPSSLLGRLSKVPVPVAFA